MHVMIDLETLGTSTDCSILAIGAVKFNPNLLVQKPGIDLPSVDDAIYIPIDPVSCQQVGLKIDAATVMWWLEPERETARRYITEKAKEKQLVDLPSALDGLSRWLTDAPVPRTTPVTPRPHQLIVWSNGTNFDIMIMRHAFKVCGMELPWTFHDERCFRTLKNLIKLSTGPTAHHALQDATDQARAVQRIIAELGITI